MIPKVSVQFSLYCLLLLHLPFFALLIFSITHILNYVLMLNKSLFLGLFLFFIFFFFLFQVSQHKNKRKNQTPLI